MTEPVLESGLLPEGVLTEEPDKLKVGKIVSLCPQECSFIKTKLYVDVPNYGELYIHFFNSFIPHTFLLDVANAPDTLLGTTRIKLSKAGNSLVFQ